MCIECGHDVRVGSNQILISSLLNLIYTLAHITRGVIVQFGSVFSEKKFKPITGLSWFGFHSFSKEESNQTNWFRSVRLIGLFKNTSKKNPYSHKFVFHV